MNFNRINMPKIPNTPAIRTLKQYKAIFEVRQYRYEDKGGTRQTADELGVDEHAVIKTLVFEAEGELIIVLQHGDKEVSAKELARALGVKKAAPADAKKAFNATGYRFGGTSPFGTKRNMRFFAEETIFGLDKIYINGGARGLILELSPEVIDKILAPAFINCAI